MVESLTSRTRTTSVPASKVFHKVQAAREEKGKRVASGDSLSLTSAITTVKSQPTPIEPEGRLDYYQRRHLDFQARHPDKSPPSYYLGYGDVYVRRFTEVLAPELSQEGQEWLVRARKNLQVAIEDELARNPDIELDDAAFTAFAYDTHGPAYLDAGLVDLPLGDLIRIAVTPNLSDTLNAKGLKVITETAGIVAREKLAAAMDAPEELAREMMDLIANSPDLLRDVVTLLDTAENARMLREGLLGLKSLPREAARSLVEGVYELTMRKLRDVFNVFEALRKDKVEEAAAALATG